MKLKRLIPLLLCLALLLACVPFAWANGWFAKRTKDLSIGTGSTLLTAADHWSMGPGWMDSSTAEDIVFSNTTDTAGANICKDLIEGGNGFRISFHVDFLDPAVQTTAGTTLRLNSDSMTYFDIRITGRGDELMFQVDYCDSGNWSSVVPFTAGIFGASEGVTVEIAREAAHNTVSFTILDAAGNELLSQNATNTVWAGSRFVDRGDLEMLFKPYAGYGTFRVSKYSVNDFPDDGVEPALSAADLWTMGSNWSDVSTSDMVVIKNNIENAGPSFFKEKINGAKDFRLGFLYTGESNYTTADITLRLTSDNNVYLRMLVTQNGGTALVDVNFYNGSTWSSLGSTGWISGVGSSYYVTFEHLGGTDNSKLILTKPDGTMIASCVVSGSAATNDSFYAVSELEALVTTAGNYGIFSIGGFTTEAAAVPASQWSMGTNWTGEYNEDGLYTISNLIQNAGPNFFSDHIAAGESFRLGFLYEGKSSYTTADITLRLTSNTASYLRLLVTQNNGTALVDFNFTPNGANWTQLVTTGWMAEIGSSFYVYLEHEGGTDTMTLTLCKTDGSQFFSKVIDNAALTDDNFFSVFAIEPLVTTAGNYGLFSIADFRIDRPVSAEDSWILGEGWTDAGGYDGAKILAAADSNGSALWKQELNAAQGLVLDFDFETRVKEMQTSGEFILRLSADHSQYLRLVITGRGTQEAMVEAQYFANGTGITLASTGWISNAAVNGNYHLRLAHQGGASETLLELTAKDGTILYSKAFSNAAFTDRSFWGASYLQALFNPISGYGSYAIGNFTLTEYPSEAVEPENWRLGNGWKAYADGAEGIYLAKEQKGTSEAVYLSPIRGAEGFQISFDISFDNTQTSSCCIKLRVPTAEEIYLFARVKGANNQTLLEAQSYDSTAEIQWSSSLLSADASRWHNNNGVVTVLLERQAMSEELHFSATDKASGEVLIDETFSSPVLNAADYLDYNNLEWIFSADEDSSTFKIYDFAVNTYPADPVAVETLEIQGETQVYTGTLYGYTMKLNPDDATVKSYRWLVNGVSVSTGKTVNYLFSQAGSYTLTLEVTDYEGIVTTATLSVTAEAAPLAYETGDLNEDGNVDGTDAQLLADYLVGNRELSEAQLSRADINSDGSVDITDVYCILGKEG